MAGSGTIPRSFIDDLVTRIDIVDLIDSYVPLKRAGRSYVACCPFHQEKSPSFNVSQAKQFYHCFGCGVSGNAISFMMAHRNLEFREAITELAARAGMVVPHENSTQTQFSQDLYTLLSRVVQYYQEQLYQSPNATHAREYLKKRGLSSHIIKEYQLGYSLDGWNHLSNAFPRTEKELIATGMLVEKPQGRPYDQYRDRLMFPIHDRRGRIIGFGGRVLDDKKLPKYINSPETTLFHKSKALYGLYQVAQKNPHPDYILVVEGYMDVIALVQNGIPDVVATLGTATTRDHIQSLLRYTKKLVFCFDGDNAGRKAAWKALESTLPYLDAQAQFQFMFLPEGEDPDTLVRQEKQPAFIGRIQTAKPLDIFFFEELMRHLDLSVMADCSKLVETAKSYFSLMPVCAYRDLMMEQLARFARINVDAIEKRMRGEKGEEKKQVFVPVPAAKTRTNMRIALTLLIQNPSLVEKISVIPELSLLENVKGGKILHELITTLKQDAIKSTGQLLEYYRGHDYMDWISKLAMTPYEMPGEIQEEFLGALENIQKESMDKKIKMMLQQKHAGNYSNEDKRLLLEMMIQKKKPKNDR